MNEFNRGIEYAIDVILNNLKEIKLGNKKQQVITKEELLSLKKNIPLKCNFCTTPCGNDWCPTKINMD